MCPTASIASSRRPSARARWATMNQCQPSRPTPSVSCSAAGGRRRSGPVPWRPATSILERPFAGEREALAVGHRLGDARGLVIPSELEETVGQLVPERPSGSHIPAVAGGVVEPGDGDRGGILETADHPQRRRSIEDREQALIRAIGLLSDRFESVNQAGRAGEPRHCPRGNGHSPPPPGPTSGGRPSRPPPPSPPRSGLPIR